ncbi:FKBP-type peptidyl-prolyl cis-trans isomerase [Candidatus Woesearchaeota archaeon]|nr:FKBP-type peptidyl-prolyl cis-trans isomerase [Candidatus Woesearchaeota archaeon]
MKTAKNGDKVKVEYTLTLDDGQVVDTSKGRDPLEFTLGEGHVIKGFNDAVVGMKVNEEKDFKVEPKDGYGEPRPDMKLKLPRQNLSKEQTPQVGMIIGMTMQDGRKAMGKIFEVTEEHLGIDLNHPLAGEVLNFHIKLISF